MSLPLTWEDTPELRPRLAEAELEAERYFVEAPVDLHLNEKPALKGGCAYITSHRLLWADPARLARYSWPLSQVLSLSTEPGGLLWDKSPKLLLKCAAGHLAKLAFPSGGLDKALKAAEEALTEHRKELERLRSNAEKRVAAAAAAASAPPPPSSSAVGLTAVSHILVAGRTEGITLANDAFRSIDGLTALAEEVVKKAAELSARLLAPGAGRGGSSSSGGGGGGGSDSASAAPPPASEVDDLSDLLREMGSVANPITRETAGSKQYVVQLAAQLAGFVRPKVVAAGGMLPLTDAFVMYNRARGLDTVTPEDMLLAVGALGGGGSAGGLRCRSLGGQRVLQLAELSDAQMVGRVEAFLRQGGGAPTSAMLLAAETRAPLAVAAMQLELAEVAGVVCRDVSLAGTRFFLSDPFIKGGWRAA